MLSLLFGGGDIEVEERRPLSFNEPRRKRLAFVRDSHRSRSHRRSPRSSDEWAVVPHSGSRRRGRDEDEIWDERKITSEERFLRANAHKIQQDHTKLMQKGQRLAMERERMAMDRDRRMLAQGGMQRQFEDPRMRGMPPAPPMGEPRMQEFGGGRTRPRIQQIGSPRSGSHNGDWGHEDDSDPIVAEFPESSDESDRGRRSPRRIEKVRDRQASFGRGGSRSRSHSRGIKDKKKKRKGGKKSKKTKKRRSSSLFSDTSSSSSGGEDEFVKGYVAGKSASRSSKRRQRGRGLSRDMAWSDDEDSFDDLGLRHMLRSKSRLPIRRRADGFGGGRGGWP
ncbi:serine arginine-rich splicing factor [Puttea exsequens]|nr:serine arginine-rich splicing factor [Puttea exsequens]